MDTGEQAAAEESSASRRERLLALRSAAAAASSSSPSAVPPPPPAWDLPEPDLAPSSASQPPARFGFYTNPGAAFSSATAPHKRKSPDSLPGPPPGPAPPHAGSVNYGNNYPPPHQHHMAPSQMEPAPPGTSPWRSPVQFQTPMQEYGGVPPGPPPHWNPHSASPAQDSYPRPPNFGFGGSNVGRGGNPMNYGPRGSPVNYGPRGGPMNYGQRGGPMNYGPRGGPMNYGPRGSPCSPSGRGRGENYYSSPGSRGGGRGGSGHQNHFGGHGQRDYHYKSMVDDPWKNLEPIVGSILVPIGGGSPMNYGPRGGPMNYGPRGSLFTSSGRGRGENYYSGPGSTGGGRGGSGFQNHFGVQEKRDWLPESLRTKKHAPDQGQTIPNSGLSLAEYLDLSFNEVSKET